MSEPDFDLNLGRVMKRLQAVPEASPEFERVLLERTQRVARHKRRRRWAPRAAAAALLAGVGVVIFVFATRPDVNTSDVGGSHPYPLARDVADAPAVSAHRPLFGGVGEEEAEYLYLNPIRYLHRHGVDPSVRGLMAFYAALARGETTQVDEPRYACLDALVYRLGARAAPLLIRLHALDPSPASRSRVLAAMRRTRDATALPYLETTIARCPADGLVELARTLASFGVPDAGCARRVRARADQLGLLDARAEGFVPARAAELLGALRALGDTEVKRDAARLLATTADIRLLEICPDHAEARDELAREALAEAPSFASARLLAVLCRASDARAAGLLELQLKSTDLACFGSTVRAVGRGAPPPFQSVLRPVLVKALAALHPKAADQRIALLWALARGGDRAAVGKIREILAAADDPIAFEWGVDALLDLRVDEGEVLMAFPDQPWVLGRLVVLLERDSGAVERTAPAKIAALEPGDLRLALELVLEPGRGATPRAAVRDYLSYCAEYGGKNRRFLLRPDPQRIRATLADSTGRFGTRLAALHALHLVEGEAALKVEIADRALSDRAENLVPFREITTRLLDQLGTPEAGQLLADRAAKEPDPLIRAAMFRAIARRPGALDAYRQLGPGDDLARILLLDGIGRARDDLSRAQVAEILAGAYESGTPDIRRIAAFHVVQNGMPGEPAARAHLLAEADAADPVDSLVAEECLLALEDEKGLVEAWIRRLRSGDSVRRLVAAGRLRVWTGQALGASAADWEAWWATSREGFSLRPRAPGAKRRDEEAADLFEPEEEY